MFYQNTKLLFLSLLCASPLCMPSASMLFWTLVLMQASVCPVVVVGSEPRYTVQKLNGATLTVGQVDQGSL